MRNRKHTVSILLSLCILCTIAAPATAHAAAFRDVRQGDWFYDAAQYASSNGIMSGTGNNNFSPNTAVTRGMLATILYRMEGEPFQPTYSYIDIADDRYQEPIWYAAPLSWTDKNNIMSGDGRGRMLPTVAITREQAVTALYRYAKYKGCNVSAAADLSRFSDGRTVSSYAVEPMRWAVGIGLVSGSQRNELLPKGNTSRAQIASMLMRLCELSDISPLPITKYIVRQSGISTLKDADVDTVVDPLEYDDNFCKIYEIIQISPVQKKLISFSLPIYDTYESEYLSAPIIKFISSECILMEIIPYDMYFYSLRYDFNSGEIQKLPCDILKGVASNLFISYYLHFDVSPESYDLYTSDGKIIDTVVNEEYVRAIGLSKDFLYYAYPSETDYINNVGREKRHSIWRYNLYTHQKEHLFDINCMDIEKIGEGFICYYISENDSMQIRYF